MKIVLHNIHRGIRNAIQICNKKMDVAKDKKRENLGQNWKKKMQGEKIGTKASSLTKHL